MSAINDRILDTLGALDKALGASSPLVVNESEVMLISDNRKIAEISRDDVIVLGNSFQKVFRLSEESSTTSIDQQSLPSFLISLSKDLVRLNHLGLSYFVDDLADEVRDIKALAESFGVNLYEEVAETKDERWLFAGNAEKWDQPLFEFVLSKGSGVDAWRSHFQIDIDTSLAPDELEKLANEAFGERFFKWKLDMPSIGVVLMMGILENINGSKIALGVGTNLRDTKYHRINSLKKIA